MIFPFRNSHNFVRKQTNFIHTNRMKINTSLKENLKKKKAMKGYRARWYQTTLNLYTRQWISKTKKSEEGDNSRISNAILKIMKTH